VLVIKGISLVLIVAWNTIWNTTLARWYVIGRLTRGCLVGIGLANSTDHAKLMPNILILCLTYEGGWVRLLSAHEKTLVGTDILKIHLSYFRQKKAPLFEGQVGLLIFERVYL